MTKTETPRIGYVPYSNSLKSPGDRRRFVAYAKARQLEFEIASPNERYDLVVLSEAADISIWSQYRHGKLVYDLIDSYLAIPRTNIKQWLRGPIWYAMGRYRKLRFNLWAAIGDMCRRADAVICTTESQRKDILSYSSNVHLILDIHTSVVQHKKTDYSCAKPINLVWEGLPNNIIQLKQLRDVLGKINQSRPLVLNIVTDPDQPRFLSSFGRIKSIDLAQKIFHNVVLHPWNEKTCSKVIRDCDLAVIPIDLSDPFVAGKPENKLLLLWRMGMPVVTSATPAYKSAMHSSGLQELACETPEEWQIALEQMIGSEQRRKDVGLRGLEFAEKYFSKQMMLTRWDIAFASIGFSFDVANK